jgi:phage shock protein A
MEDTLVEIKASCAGVMAERKKAERQLEEMAARSAYWEEKAGMAVNKGRDDLAREALHEKRRYTRRMDVLESEIADLNQLVEQYQDDIRQLEEKLKNARNKQRMLTQRHIHAKRKRQAQEDIRRMDSAEVVRKFDDFEGRIERMESEADLVNYGRRTTLEEELDKLHGDEEIEAELEALKKKPASDKDTKDDPHATE